MITADLPPAPQWEMVEIALEADHVYANPYVAVEVWVDFTHEDGTTLRRPGFWDGDDTFRVRFASPKASGVWTWESDANVDDSGLTDESGSLAASPPMTDNAFTRHGFWTMDPGSRQIRHQDGTVTLMVADTPWALPWRATHDQVKTYAADRQAKGFNAALLMSVMPDQDAEGPTDRTLPHGFARGFADLEDGELKQLDPTYFQYLDQSVAILVQHEIVPVWNPVFHGFGWKGLRVAGPDVPPADFARYCRYLVARYGAYPAMWLVLADGNGHEATIRPGGREIERWDAYQHPTGLHYGPHWPPQAKQAEPWLDFQWTQTGHNGEHRPERITAMWFSQPTKAAANGEPTYENIGRMGNGAGWWQGHEAWSNLCAGGVMGVVYGAGSLWNWLHPGEADHPQWARAPATSWREALDFEGSKYVGLMRHILHDLPLAGITPDHATTYGRRAVFAPDQLLIVYLENGGNHTVIRDDIPDRYRVYDLQTGEITRTGSIREDGRSIADTGTGPRAVIYSTTY
jgi:hypothetical protein